MPVVVLVALFSGVATAVEASALTAAVRAGRAGGRFTATCRSAATCCACSPNASAVIGGVLVILGVAVGLDQLAGRRAGADAAAGVHAASTSGRASCSCWRSTCFCSLVGCLMEIFPAIVVVVPLIVPLGAAFGIHPVHLGIIFIANLELGYLTPLVGLNILLASYRFKRPVLEVARAALPMAGILGIGVLVITYVPWLTLGILQTARAPVADRGATDDTHPRDFEQASPDP